ncbi:MAG: DUF4215 domain-containing protein [Deltaproteobacteria bacterium]|nr:DUF4215 domain-containing protein [Deltaproteobacteria bacterium]
MTVVGCGSATIVDNGQGGAAGGNTSAGGGAAGTQGGGGGVVVNLDAFPVGDAGVDRPGGGTCGDGIIERSEQCDDGNTDSGDGCSRICQIEANWDCPTQGQPCVYLGVCGNGILTSNKACDDGNTTSGDGCSDDCQTVEPGYICRKPGNPCTPLCGDSQVIKSEECDDGNATSGDGCSAICRVEPGWTCSETTPSTCTHSVCGNGKVEAGEGCDDGNSVPFDGCSPTCQNDPVCGTAGSAVGECTTSCGDGLLIRGGAEACDDGNQNDGDGCSKDCKIEPGNTCQSAYDNPPEQLELPIVARDFQWYDANANPPTGHPDFGTYCCDDSLMKSAGVLRSTLDVSRKPVWAGPDPVPDPKQLLFTGKAAFDQWYRDTSGINMTYYSTLILLRSATDQTTYAMNSDTDQPWYDRCGFFPLDSSEPLVDQNTGNPITYTETINNVQRTCHAYKGLGFGNSWANHNFAFTTELRYWFQYQGNENLTFTGDDDVWVFVNGTLAVDLGGVHNRAIANVVLDASKGTGQVSYPNSQKPSASIDFKLTIGNVYEVVVFQAERWCCGSNYMLTLANFLAGRSLCGPTCGDGVATGTEECDLGAENSDTAYGGCTTQCTWGPFCGDGVVQAPPDGPEECDLGKQNGDTTLGKDGCSIACKKPRGCGDGIVDTDLGEECDLAGNNGVKLDSQLQPTSDPDDPAGQVFCTVDCAIPPGIVY